MARIEPNVELDRNRPHNLDELYRWNDLELFDLQQDPAETKNLAMTKGENAALVATMSERKTVILTGASRGIGHATVKRFSAAGGLSCRWFRARPGGGRTPK